MVRPSSPAPEMRINGDFGASRDCEVSLEKRPVLELADMAK